MKTEGYFIQINDGWCVRKSAVNDVLWRRAKNWLEFRVVGTDENFVLQGRAEIRGFLGALGLHEFWQSIEPEVKGC